MLQGVKTNLASQVRARSWNWVFSIIQPPLQTKSTGAIASVILAAATTMMPPSAMILRTLVVNDVP